MKLFFRYFFRLVRLILGPVLLLIEWVSTPNGIKRSAEEQKNIDQQTRNLALYQFKTCPFCIKVRRSIKRLSLNIDIKDAQKDPENRHALLEGGGKIKVPCLRITDENNNTQWLYESDEIIRYLEEKYA